MLHHIVAPPLDRSQLLHRTLVPQAADALAAEASNAAAAPS